MLTEGISLQNVQAWLLGERLNGKKVLRFRVIVKRFMRAPNFEVSSPIFECRMPRSENSSQRCAPNVPIFQWNVRTNLANFIQDLFWRMSFLKEGFKTVEDLGGPWRSSRFELEFSGSRYCSKCGM